MIKKVWLCCSRQVTIAPKRIAKDNDVCRVYSDNKTLIIAFDGSNDLKDWVSNFRAGRYDDEHKGFFDSFDKFKKALAGILTQLPRPRQVIFTGHSRGGALATLAAKHFTEVRTIKRCSCITFGAPKVGDREFRNDYNLLPIDHTGYRNGWDIVTYLPPSVTGYRHVGKIIRLKRPWYRKLLLSFRIADHLTGSYDKQLKKLFKNKR